MNEVDVVSNPVVNPIFKKVFAGVGEGGLEDAVPQ